MSYKRTLFTILMIAALGMAMSAATFTAAKEIADTPRNPAAPAQTTVTLNAVADATVREWAPDANFGDEGSLELSYGGPGEEAVTLVRFDLSGLPSDAIVDSASMRLYLEGAGGADPVTIAAYAVTSTWEETGEEGVTWNTFPTAAWIGINADIDGEEGSYKSWQATSFAQSWIDDPASNYGVMLRGPTEDYERWFESRDHMEMVPQLEVTYHLPPYTFTGHVYEGEPEDTSTLLEGVTVELWGDEDEWPESGAERVLLASDLPTGPDGAFLLEWDRASAWPYLHVIETDPADAISTGADADPPGSVTNDNVITYRYDDLLETGLHDFGGIAFWDRFPEEELSDLIVTDIWPEGAHICFEVQNIGSAVAPSGHQAALSIDGDQQATLTVGVDLASTATWDGCFDYTWVCSGEADTIVVRADATDVMAESDETNNRREEIWTCDVTPPQIVSGPTVSDVTATSSVISWETDEAANSVVRYDNMARSYRFEATDAASTTSHEVTLTGLTSSTTYHYVVSSTDAAGNSAESRDHIFETLPPPDDEIPTVGLIVPTVVSGTVTLHAEAEDDTRVEKVSFYANDVLLHTDYSAPYNAILDSTRYADGQLTLTAEAHDLAGRSAPAATDVMVLNRIDDTLPTVTITSPSEGATVQGEVQVQADLEDDVGLYEVHFRIDGKYQDHRAFTGSPKQDTVTFDWDTTGLPAGAYRIGLQVYDTEAATDFYRDHATATRDVSVLYLAPPAPAKLQVSRDVQRDGNVLWVNLHVTNSGGQAADGLTIDDWLHGFQPLSDSRQTPVQAVYTGRYDRNSGEARCRIQSLEPIPQGQTRTFTYAAVPILFDDPFFGSFWFWTRKPTIGQKTALSYYDTAEHDHRQTSIVKAPAKDVMSGGAWKPVATAYDEALATADYVLVTHPRNLELAITPLQPTAYQDLLNDMAWLAKERGGVLGFLDTYDRHWLLSLIKPGGFWARRLAPKFSTTLGGYVLIVGESEIVPNWTISGIEQCDQPYAGGHPPQRIVGRIIGNTHAKMSKVIRASLGVELNWPGHTYDRSHAFLVSGTDGTSDGVSKYKDCVNDIADILDKRGVDPGIPLHLYDLGPSARISQFKSGATGNDIILFRDHGSVDKWCPVTTNDILAHPILDLGMVKPVAISLSCLAGCYEDHTDYHGGDYNIAEAFFDRGAAVYIGATEKTGRSSNNAGGRWFFKNWKASETIGKAFADLEARPYGSAYWAHKYNLYGDPKFGATTSAQATGAAAPADPGPVLDIVLPDYEVRHHDGTDYVSFPAGGLLLEEGEPEIPFHVVTIDYPADTRVQQVTLTDRSGLSTTTGLNLPITTMAPDCDHVLRPTSSTTEAWLPQEPFDWQLIDNPDGTATLAIAVYAFRYHPQTTDVRFYRDYSFAVETISSTVAITGLETEKAEYAPGEEATFDVEIANTGDPQDVVVEVAVKRYVSGRVVETLRLTTLDGLQGTASFADAFDTGSVDPGYYLADVALRDAAGNTLDRETHLFRVGTVSGEVSDLTVAPTLFQPGDEVSASLTFTNTGTVPISGTLNITVVDESGAAVEAFSHKISGLPPSESRGFTDAWDTTGAAEGMYHVVGVVHYDGRATTPQIVHLGTRVQLYLPLTLRRVGSE